MTESVASNWNVYGQSNETDSRMEDLANFTPNIDLGQNNEDTDE
jgi:hypothetical protein